jgi:nicotinamidase-related amidase
MDYLAPDWSSSALVTIDTQVDTLDGQALEIPGTSAAVPQIVALAAAFRDAGRPIVHVVRLYRKDGSNVDICRRSIVEAGAEILAPESRGSQLAPEIVEHASFELEADRLLQGRLQQVGPAEVVIYKPRWGAFYETPLEDHLRRQAFPRSCSAAATSPTVRARPFMRQASATFGWCWPRMQSQASTTRVVTNSRA